MLIALYLGHLSVSVSLSVANWLKYTVVVHRAEDQCKNRDSLPRKAGSLLILLSVLAQVYY